MLDLHCALLIGRWHRCRCDTCHKKLNSISGLSIHCNQVHKVLVER